MSISTQGLRPNRAPRAIKNGALALALLGAMSSFALLPSQARASGYDAPVLYNARYAGMGGTGISYVEGGTSMVLNPAGLGNVGVANLDIAQTILIGRLRGTPTFLQPDTNLWSEVIPNVLPLVGGAYRLHEYVVVGVGAFPTAGVAAKYSYDWPGQDEPLNDETEALFVEMTAGFAINVDQIGLRIGAGYRITYARLTRKRNDPLTTLDLQPDGWNFGGFRVGLQWTAPKHFTFGAVFRSKVSVPASQNGGRVLQMDFDSVSLPLTLPARVGGGFRFDIEDFGFSAEFEWIFNSQNGQATIETNPPIDPPLVNEFDWADQYFLRLGAEYRFLGDRWPWRAGFVWESSSSSGRFPNAFSPPPTGIPTVTIGTGYNHGPWQMNVAYSYGWATTVVDVDTSDFFQTCPNCGGAGTYAIRANQLFFDFSYNWR